MMQDTSYTVDERNRERITQSLYDLVKAKRETSDTAAQVIDNPPIARLLYAALINESYKEAEKIDVEQQICDQIKQIQNEGDEADQLNGVIQIKGNCVIHLLEGDSNIINNKFIKDYLYPEFKKQPSIFQQINIICFNEENPSRLFDKHYQPNAGGGTQPALQLSPDVDKTEEQVTDRTWAIYNQFCEAGKKQGDKKNGGYKSKKSIENEIQVSTDDLSMMVMSKTYYMNIQDYYDMYLDDVEINLDGELVYPYTPSLISNLEYSENGHFPQVKL